MRIHFLKSHYLCELDGCSANAAQTHEYVVFRTELDFQAHKKQKHARSKSDARALGKLNIEFNFNDSARDRQQRRRGGGRGGGGGGGSGGGAEAASNYDHDERGGNQRVDPNDVDVNVLRASREQYEADEAERTRQRRLEAMREQHRKYEETLQKQQEKVVKKPDEEAKKPEPPPPPTPAVAAAAAAAAAADVEPPSMWRNLISGGNVPRINKEAEFPSLGGGGSGAGGNSGKLMSLAELGASISSSSSKLENKFFNGIYLLMC